VSSDPVVLASVRVMMPSMPAIGGGTGCGRLHACGARAGVRPRANNCVWMFCPATRQSPLPHTWLLAQGGPAAQSRIQPGRPVPVPLR
jgi:hypothetical protein